jgi:hypothetical protein
MLIHYFVEVPMACDQVVPRLADAGERLDEWALAAYQRGEAMQVRVGPRAVITKRVELDLGRPAEGNGSTVFPLRWRPAGAGALFPAMEADVVVAPLGQDVTQISFEGRYDPPLEGFGRLLDRAVFHRLAQSTVRDFVDRMAAWVVAEPTSVG